MSHPTLTEGARVCVVAVDQTDDQQGSRPRCVDDGTSYDRVRVPITELTPGDCVRMETRHPNLYVEAEVDCPAG